MKEILLLGLAFIIIGFILVIAGMASSADRTATKFAFGGFIGFIPFGFANDKRMLAVVLGLSALLIFVWILYFLWR